MSLNINFDKDFIDAANYVLEEHLRHPYKEGFGDGGRQPGHHKQQIDRPLHGLIHAMRKVAYAPIYYQLLRGNGETLKEGELKKIMIALLFQISGRESELNNGDKRSRYRQASANNFEKFAKEHMRHLFTAEDIKKYKTIIAETEPNPYKKSTEMKIMRQVHALELIRLQDKAIEMFYMSPKYNGIAGGLVKQFNEESAVNFMDYIVALFAATGDTLDEIDVGP
ncbi:MAG TPA: SidE phosphodiesterase domain-containing protein, partial [Candidatus Berkiella sp.]|nr:SidE phosphodiesterase domain-containing protein [Candidatus Berkiella sp.]